MKIVAVSDLHGYLPDVEECDLLILGGDLCPDYTVLRPRHHALDTEGWRQQTWLDREFRAWLEQVPARHIVGIAGNHDFVFGRHRHHLTRPLPWTYLEDAETAVEGLRVYGTPWVPNLPFWAFYAPEDRLEMRAAAIPEGIDVLVTHGPPYGYADTVSPRGFHAGTRVGDASIERELRRIMPKAVICGHIHENNGVYAHPCGAAIYSVALMDDGYEPTGKPATLYL